MQDNSFLNQSNLEILNLAKNMIQINEHLVFKGLSKLINLYLQNNSLKNI